MERKKTKTSVLKYSHSGLCNAFASFAKKVKIRNKEMRTGRMGH